MRRPTPQNVALEWWSNAIATGSNAITDDMPRCGWFKTRAKAWSKIFLPARIWLDQRIDWETGDLTDQELFVLQIGNLLIRDQEQIEERWLRLRAITLDEWRWLTAHMEPHHGTAPPIFEFDY